MASWVDVRGREGGLALQRRGESQMLMPGIRTSHMRIGSQGRGMDPLLLLGSFLLIAIWPQQMVPVAFTCCSCGQW
uniref:Uncharacterized protein n=1 Tax=Oryza glumipatula TaxID=40148 RepID=A0A0D9ZBQ9_9ORYZ